MNNNNNNVARIQTVLFTAGLIVIAFIFVKLIGGRSILPFSSDEEWSAGLLGRYSIVITILAGLAVNQLYIIPRYLSKLYQFWFPSDFDLDTMEQYAPMYNEMKAVGVDENGEYTTLTKIVFICAIVAAVSGGIIMLGVVGFDVIGLVASLVGGPELIRTVTFYIALMLFISILVMCGIRGFMYLEIRGEYMEMHEKLLRVPAYSKPSYIIYTIALFMPLLRGVAMISDFNTLCRIQLRREEIENSKIR